MSGLRTDGEVEMPENEKKSGNVFGYLVILFYVLYLVVLFAERTVAVVMGFSADEPFCLRDDIAQWYAHIATV